MCNVKRRKLPLCIVKGKKLDGIKLKNVVPHLTDICSGRSQGCIYFNSQITRVKLNE